MMMHNWENKCFDFDNWNLLPLLRYITWTPSRGILSFFILFKSVSNCGHIIVEAFFKRVYFWRIEGSKPPGEQRKKCPFLVRHDLWLPTTDLLSCYASCILTTFSMSNEWKLLKPTFHFHVANKSAKIICLLTQWSWLAISILVRFSVFIQEVAFRREKVITFHIRWSKVLHQLFYEDTRQSSRISDIHGHHADFV